MTIDVERFLENIGKEYKTMLLALAFIFPLAYSDCWKLSVSFPKLDINPQVILAFAVSVLLMAGGVLMDLAYQACVSSGKFAFKLDFSVLIMPTIPSSIFVIIGGIDSVKLFCFIYAGVVASFYLWWFFKKLLDEIR